MTASTASGSPSSVSPDLTDAYRLHHIDTGSITDAALTLLRR